MYFLKNRIFLFILGPLFILFGTLGYLVGQLQKNPYQTDTAAATPPPYIEEIPHLVDNCNFEFWTCEENSPHSVRANISKMHPHSLSLFKYAYNSTLQAGQIIEDSRQESVNGEPSLPGKVSYKQGLDILANHYNINPHVLYPIVELHSNIITQSHQGPEHMAQTANKVFPQYEGGLFDRTLQAIHDLSSYYKTYSPAKPATLKTSLGELYITDQSAATLAVTRLMSETFTDPRMLSHALSESSTATAPLPTYVAFYQSFSGKDPRQP